MDNGTLPTPLLPATDTHLDWVVRKRRAFVTWQDDGANRRCLGQLSPHNLKTHFTLWIGRNVQKNQLLVMLHLPISLRASSSTRPRHMFLIVPAESLHVGTADESFEALTADQVLQSLPDAFQFPLSAECNRLLRIPIKLQKKSSVLMPTDEYRGMVKGTPLKLLSELKALSESLSFDVYMNFNSYAQLDLCHIRDKLHNEGLTTPAIDLDRMYGRGGGFDLWHAQGLRNNTDAKALHLVGEKGETHSKHVASDMVARETSPPPPYEPGPQSKPCIEAHAEPSAELQTKPETELLLDACTEPRVESGMQPHAASCAWPHPTFSAASYPASSHAASSGTAHQAGPCSATDQRPSSKAREEDGLCTGFVSFDEPGAGVRLDQWSTSPTIQVSHSDTDENCGSTTIEGSSVVEETPPRLLSGPIFADDLAPTTFKVLHSPSLLLPQSGTRKRKGTISNSLKPESLNIQPSRPHHDKQARSAQSTQQELPSFATSEVKGMAPETLFAEIIHWLHAALKVDPNAHRSLLTELLTLGAAARKGDVAAFDQMRAICSARLALQAAGAGKHVDTARLSPLDTMEAFERELIDLVKWMNSIDRYADVILQESLVSLAQKAKALKTPSPNDRPVELEQHIGDCNTNRFERDQRDFSLQMARCIASTFFYFG